MQRTLLCLGILVAGCGGGGAPPPPPPVLQLDSPATIVQLQGTAESVLSTAMFGSGTDLRAARLALVGSPNVLESDRAAFELRTGGAVGIAVGTRAELAPGDYVVTYRLEACFDGECSLSNELTHGVTVVPRLSLTIAGGRCNSFCSFWLVPTGATIVATANVPVTWELHSDPSAPVQFRVVSSTPTRWEAVISGAHTPAVASTASLTATALQQPTYRGSSATQAFYAMPPDFY